MGLSSRNAARLLAMLAANAATGQAKTCTANGLGGTDNYGPGIELTALEVSTPFDIGMYGAVITFDAKHCIQMCCEQELCALAVHNDWEGACYLKSSEALNDGYNMPAGDLTSYTITSREGPSEPVKLGPTQCSNKRGAAFGFEDPEDLKTLKDGLSWWYDWSPGALTESIMDASAAQDSEYVPMIWGEGDLAEGRLLNLEQVGHTPYLMGFNEPNYGTQANLTPQEAANLWPKVRELGRELGAELVSPAVNFCFGDCNEEDPVAWLDQFFAACGNVDEGDYCGITHLAVHSYTCEVRYLNKHINTYTKYGLPIWLTEFACGFEATELDEEGQANFLKQALTYLEMSPYIFRYAWFTVVSAEEDGLENSVNLLDSDTKKLTQVGKVFITDYADLQHCGMDSTTPAPVDGQAATPAPVDGKAATPAPVEAQTATPAPADARTTTPAPVDAQTATPAPADAQTTTPAPVDAQTATPAPVDAQATTPAPVDDNGGSEEGEEENPALVIVSEPTGGELDVDPVASVIVNAVITNVGGTGYYDDVVDMIDGENMHCPDFDEACVKEEVCVSGDLVPFDEVSVAFRGPLNLYNIAWYEGTADETLERTTTWTQGETGENIAFMKNKGGVPGCSGEWSICGGNSQTFADATGTTCTDDMTNFDGNLPDDNEINIMTGWQCASQEQCGFYRDMGMRGWTGGDDGTKVMMFEVDMPHCGEESCDFDRPAVWALNARVLRTAQYGCNCRGMGGNGGCGEFDILEAVIGNQYSDMLFVQVYDFKGAGSPGTAKYFERPSERTTYAAVFRGGSGSYLQVVQLDNWDFTATTLAPSQLDSIKGSEQETHAIYDVDSRAASSSGGCAESEGGGTDNGGNGDGAEEPLTLAAGYEYVGCFHDMFPISERDMPLSTKREFPENKPRMCANRCSKEEGAAFFGLQNGGLCWCGGMGDTGPGSYGVADGCDVPCPGNDSVACGGKRMSSVYVLPVEYSYVGCFADERGDRDMRLVPKAVSDVLTPAACAAYCSSVEGADYFGVQAGRKCFCGDSFGRHGESTLCVEPCTGDKDQVCGAHNVNSVYTFLPPDEVEHSPADAALGDEQAVCDEDGRCGCFLSKSLGEQSLMRGGRFGESETLSRASCKATCEEKGFPFYGLEWSILCYCGGMKTTKTRFVEGIAEYKLADATEACSMPCPAGDTGDTCGGSGAIEIWEV